MSECENVNNMGSLYIVDLDLKFYTHKQYCLPQKEWYCTLLVSIRLTHFKCLIGALCCSNFTKNTASSDLLLISVAVCVKKCAVLLTTWHIDLSQPFFFSCSTNMTKNREFLTFSILYFNMYVYTYCCVSMALSPSDDLAVIRKTELTKKMDTQSQSPVRRSVVKPAVRQTRPTQHHSCPRRRTTGDTLSWPPEHQFPQIIPPLSTSVYFRNPFCVIGYSVYFVFFVTCLCFCLNKD